MLTITLDESPVKAKGGFELEIRIQGHTNPRACAAVATLTHVLDKSRQRLRAQRRRGKYVARFRQHDQVINAVLACFSELSNDCGNGVTFSPSARVGVD